MQTSIEGAPFAYMHVDLGSGEGLVVRRDAMASMDLGLSRRTRVIGSAYTNKGPDVRRLTIASRHPGDVVALAVGAEGLCLRAAAFLAATPDVRLTRRWSGLLPWLHASGSGTIWLGAFGGAIVSELAAAVRIRRARLIAYDAPLGLRSPAFGRRDVDLYGRGRFVTQTRGLDELRQSFQAQGR